MHAIVDISATGIPYFWDITTSIVSAKKSVSPAGSAVRITFARNSPLTSRLFGSRAKKNEGNPISMPLNKASCDGANGYGVANISVTTASIKEKIFFVRNKAADRSMLFITRLPSITTAGIAEKSESSSTISAT